MSKPTMITLDLTAKVENIVDNNEAEQGVVIEEDRMSLAGALSQVLKTANTDDPEKYFDWAVALATDGKVTVDRSDCDKILAALKNPQAGWTFIRAQLLRAIKRAAALAEKAA